MAVAHNCGWKPAVMRDAKKQAPDGVIASSNEIKYANDLGTSNNEVNQIDHSHTRRVSCLRSPLSWLVILGDQGLWASTHSYARQPHSWRCRSGDHARGDTNVEPSAVKTRRCTLGQYSRTKKAPRKTRGAFLVLKLSWLGNQPHHLENISDELMT